MYIVIRSRADLADKEKLRALMNSDRMLTRFVMNGCPWCEKTQPEWDKMTREMTPRLGERHAIAEVESDFVDHFRDLMARHHKPLPPVRRFPSVYVMSRGRYSPSPNDSSSLIRILQQMKMLRDQSPHVSFLEKELMPIKQVVLKPKSVRQRKRSRSRSQTRSQRRSKSRSKSLTPLSFTVRQRTP